MKKLRSENTERNFSFLEALSKLEAFCAYQERCQYEVDVKMAAWNLSPEQKKQLLSHLISHRFVDEERFAEAYVSGKFRIKKWGKIKIKAHLKAKRISDYSILKGLNTINEDEYYSVLEQMAKQKWEVLKDRDLWVKKSKLVRYLVAKGYEQDLVYDVAKSL